MRPRSYARKPTDAHTSSRTHLRAHTYIHPCTHMYAHVRTYTRTRRKFSNNESALQHCQTDFHHQSDTIHFYYPFTVQSISILAPHWLRHLYKLSASDNICYIFPTIFQPFTIIQSSVYPSLAYLPFIITTTHHLAQPIRASYSIFI